MVWGKRLNDDRKAAGLAAMLAASGDVHKAAVGIFARISTSTAIRTNPL
jgi:hypothetical protein